MRNCHINQALQARRQEGHLSRMVIMDRLNVMKRQECSAFYRVDDYLLGKAPNTTNTDDHPHDDLTTSSSSSSNNNSGSISYIDAWCRFKMVQWFFSVVDFLHFDRGTVCIAMSYLDRFLSSKESARARRVAEDRKEYQLAAMTALYMAIKLFEPEVIDITQLAGLSRGCYECSDFSRMECDMLFALDWHLNSPTPMLFLVHYLALLPAPTTCTKKFNLIKSKRKEGDNNEQTMSDWIFEDAKYQIELSTMHYKSITYLPSQIAAAALINSICRITLPRSTERAMMMKTLNFFIGIDPQCPDLRGIIYYLNDLQRDIGSKLGKRTATCVGGANNNTATTCAANRNVLQVVTSPNEKEKAKKNPTTDDATSASSTSSSSSSSSLLSLQSSSSSKERINNNNNNNNNIINNNTSSSSSCSFEQISSPKNTCIA